MMKKLLIAVGIIAVLFFSIAFFRPQLFVPVITYAQTHIFCAQDVPCATIANNTHTGTEAFSQLEGCQHVNALQTFAAALATVSTPGCIVVDPGTYTVSSNAALGSTVTLVSQSGGILSIATGVTLTINSSIIAPPIQVFTYVGTGTVVLGGLASPIQALWFPGSDIGAQINNAYTALPASGGAIIVAAQASGTLCYAFSTPILFTTAHKPAILQGNGPMNNVGGGAGQAGACLNYTPVTATSAITLDWTALIQIYSSGAGIRDLMLQNNGCFTNGGCGSLANGIRIGTNGAFGARFTNATVVGFGNGYSFGASANSWGYTFDGGSISMNTTGVNYTALHEADTFLGVKIVTNGTGIAEANAELNIIGGSIDSNLTCGISQTSGAILYVVDVHWENLGQTNLQYVCGASGTNLTLQGGTISDDTSGGSSAQNWFTFGHGTVVGPILNGGTGGRTYSGTIFNITDQAMVNLYSVSSTTFPETTICNPAICQLSLVSPTVRTGLTLQGNSQFTEGTAPTGIPGATDVCYGDSAIHWLKCSYNGGTFGSVPLNNAAQPFSVGLRATMFVSDQGVACTNGELTLSAGWQSTGSATVTGATGTNQTCSWTITTGTTTAANPTVTDTLPNALPSAVVVCEMVVTGGTHTPVIGAGTMDTFRQTTFSATAPVFTYQETPTAGGTTYFVMRRCGP